MDNQDIEQEQLNIEREEIENSIRMANVATQIAKNTQEMRKNTSNNNKKDKARKKKIRKISIIIIKIIIPIIFVVVIAGGLFSIFNTVKDAMIEFMSKMETSVSNLWKNITDDYWVDLGEKIEFTDENGNTENMTIVDKYIKELGSMGISLKELKLLGDADYSDEEKLLEDPENKELVERYIKEFIKADLITTGFHKRRGFELVNRNNSDLVDGGIYLFRNKNEAEIKEDDFNNSNTYAEEQVMVNEKDFEQMTYLTYDQFNEIVQDINKGKKESKSIKYHYTVDPNTEELLIPKITTTKTRTDDISNMVNIWFANISEWSKAADTIEEHVEIERVNYLQEIDELIMPYEFLINLCMITQNPEFVYHVAMLARQTRIILVVQDDTTIIRDTTETERVTSSLVNYSDDSTSGADTENEDTKKYRTTVLTTILHPNLLVEYADTWSFYKEYDYTKNRTGTKTEGNPVTIALDTPSTLSGYIPPEGRLVDSPYGGQQWEYTTYEHWYDTFDTRETSATQTIVTTISYNPAIKIAEIEKSKQFLGLLRNATGRCDNECFGDENEIERCVENAEFKEDGINVSYRIPNNTRYEMPLNKLTSGLQMLYSLMQSNSNVDVTSEEYDNSTNYNNEYNEKMDSLVTHIQYLMTYPPNEQYSVKDLAINSIWATENIYTGIIEIIPGLDFWWPVAQDVNCYITSGYGYRAPIYKNGVQISGGTGHNGIDISGQGINGQPVIASADGIVTIAKPSNSAGNYIVIDHGNGFQTRYLHNSLLAVHQGDTVTRGQIIAYIGSTGNSTGPHLHFEILYNGKPVDPSSYVSITNKHPGG